MALKLEGINQIIKYLAQMAERRQSDSAPAFMKSPEFEKQYQQMDGLLNKAQQRQPPHLKPHEENQLFNFLSMVAMLDKSLNIHAEIDNFVKANAKDPDVMLCCALARGDAAEVKRMLNVLVPGYEEEVMSNYGATEANMRRFLSQDQIQRIKDNQITTINKGNVSYSNIKFDKTTGTFSYNEKTTIKENAAITNNKKFDKVYLALCQFHPLDNIALSVVANRYGERDETSEKIREAVRARRKFVDNIETKLGEHDINYIAALVKEIQKEKINSGELSADELVSFIIDRLKPHEQTILKLDISEIKRNMILLEQADTKNQRLNHSETLSLLTNMTTAVEAIQSEKYARDLLKLIDFLDENGFAMILDDGTINITNVEGKSKDSLQNGISDIVTILNSNVPVSQRNVIDIVNAKRNPMEEIELEGINYRHLQQTAKGERSVNADNIIDKHNAVSYACEILPETWAQPRSPLMSLKEKFIEKVEQLSPGSAARGLEFNARPKTNFTVSLVDAWKHITSPEKNIHRVDTQQGALRNKW
ncbi:MAG: hypothetical protein ACHQAX_01995 [Gammaproteobacteria bacterium]